MGRLYWFHKRAKSSNTPHDLAQKGKSCRQQWGKLWNRGEVLMAERIKPIEASESASSIITQHFLDFIWLGQFDNHRLPPLPRRSFWLLRSVWRWFPRQVEAFKLFSTISWFFLLSILCGKPLNWANFFVLLVLCISLYLKYPSVWRSEYWALAWY